MTGWDRLIHRHLLGTLEPEESRELAAALRDDPRARRRLAELAFDETQLRELLAARESAPPAPRARWPKGPVAAAAAILVATTLALVIGFLRRPEAPPVAPARPVPVRKDPPFMEGLSARVKGVVLKGGEGRCVFRVDEVVEVLPDNRAEEPGRLAGREIRVAPPGGEDGASKTAVLFLRRLQPGQEHVLVLRKGEGGDFHFGPLTREQIQWASEGPRREEKKKIPDKKDPKPDPKKVPDAERKGDKRDP